MSNAFLKAATNKFSLTENGATAYISTGSKLVDQFGEAGGHRGRNINQVFADQKQLHENDPKSALQFVFYLRMITRNYGDYGINRGQGARDESFKRFLWYLISEPETFYNNLEFMTYVGSFKDLWDIAELANLNGIQIDYSSIFLTCLFGLNGDQHDLVKKYLPRIVPNSRTTTSRAKIRNKIAKMFASYLGLDYTTYRMLKSSGDAHDWQKLISVRNFESIDFNRIPGRALSLLVGSKFLYNQKLEEKYTNWIMSKPVAKFTGYVHELGDKINYALKPYHNMTINKQFDGLIEMNTKRNSGLKNVWVAIDSSGSMSCNVADGSTTAINVAKSLGIYFAALNQGEFKNHIVNFDARSTLQKLSGDFTTQYNQIRSNAMGNTNFQSVIDLLVETREKNLHTIPLEDYPTTLLVVSDLQFDPTEKGYSPFGSSNKKITQSHIDTNHNVAMKKMAEAFPKQFVEDFKIVWWNVTRKANAFQSTIEDSGTYYVSGFDGAIISLILGGEKILDKKTDILRQPTMEEKVLEALNQPVLQLINL